MKEDKKNLSSLTSQQIEVEPDPEHDFFLPGISSFKTTMRYQNTVMSPLMPYGGPLYPGGKSGVCLLPISYEMEEM